LFCSRTARCQRRAPEPMMPSHVKSLTRALRSYGDVAVSCSRSGDCAFFPHLCPPRIGTAAGPSASPRRCAGSAASGSRAAAYGRTCGTAHRSTRASYGGAGTAHGGARTAHGRARTALCCACTAYGATRLHAAAQFRGARPDAARDAAHGRAVTRGSANRQRTRGATASHCWHLAAREIISTG
jgi:hypothetical protein